MNSLQRKWLVALVMTVALSAAPLFAVSTRNFSLDTFEEFSAGELDHAVAHSNGTITAGPSLTRVGLGEVPIAYCFARASDGTLYVGTGNEGKVYRVHGTKVTEFAKTGQLLVTALTFGAGGKLLAATLPEGRIFAIEPNGKVRDFARPQGAKHILDLVFDAKRQLVFAATGPQGKVFAINPAGRAQVYFDSEWSHVMRLALDATGLYAGTSDEAVLYRLTSANKAEVIYDFPGNEITGLSIHGGTVAVAITEVSTKSALSKDAQKADEAKKKEQQVNTAPAASKPGKGQLWVVHPDGWAEQRLADGASHFTAVQLAADGVLYASTGMDGRIIRVSPEGRSAVWLDVDERQVLAFDLLNSDPLLVTADTAAVYRVGAKPAADANWTSKVLDAAFHSRWGELTWRGAGKVSFQTRSGNTERPDATWTAWSSALNKPGPIRSPAARFLQVRANLGRDSDALIRAVQAYYLPQNQRARVTDINIRPSTVEPPVDKPEVGQTTAAVARSTIVHLQWDVSNPDGDPMYYRLAFRAEHQRVWRDILEPAEKLTRSEYKWQTAAIPDGYYRIRVQANDALTNPQSRTLTSELESGPVLVDNHAPRITQLKLNGRTLRGVVQDTVGPIASLHYAIDGASWLAFYPADDLLDTKTEQIELELPDVSVGPHVVAVRATDAASNVTSAELSFSVR